MRTKPLRVTPAWPVLSAFTLACGLASAPAAFASSHREAPFITTRRRSTAPTSTCSVRTRPAAPTT